MALHTPQELLKRVNLALEKLDLEKEPARLYEPIRYALNMGGKRIRPVMCLMACELFNGDPDTIMPAALALEIFHNFTLLHDDIMDKALKRRNMDCVHIRWNDNVAILSGDAMQILAVDCLKDLPDDLFKEGLALFNRTAIEVCEGQQYDMNFEHLLDVTESDYLKMIRLKTAVLLATSLKLGAMAAKASEKEAMLLYDFGIHIGLSFQLQDDLLDVYGETAKFGKNIGGDIITNKKTYLLIQALKKADNATRAELESWLKQTNFNASEKITAITSIYDRLQIRETCQKAIEFHVNQAMSSIDAIQLPDKQKEPLIKLATELMNRTC